MAKRTKAQRQASARKAARTRKRKAAEKAKKAATRRRRKAPARKGSRRTTRRKGDMKKNLLIITVNSYVKLDYFFLSGLKGLNTLPSRL